MCWPSNVVGAFFIAVIIFDMVQKNYSDLPFHALSGVVLTFLFWLVCSFVSVTVSGAILIVPTVFISVFLFTVWFMDESLKQKGCCMNCDGNSKGKAHFVKRENPLNTSNTSNTSNQLNPLNPLEPVCKSRLTASTV